MVDDKIIPPWKNYLISIKTLRGFAPAIMVSPGCDDTELSVDNYREIS
jgi:hypothetical protein